MYTTKSEQFPYLVGTTVHVAKDNKHNLLMLLYLIGTVVCVAKNNECTLLTFYIWFVSQRIIGC